MTILDKSAALYRLLGLAVIALVLLIVLAVVVKRMPGPPLHVVSDPGLRTHFLLDYDYLVDEVSGEATIAVAGVDLIYLSLQVVLSSFDTALDVARKSGERR